MIIQEIVKLSRTTYFLIYSLRIIDRSERMSNYRSRERADRRCFFLVHPIWLVGHPRAKNSADARECETRLALWRKGRFFFSLFLLFFFFQEKTKTRALAWVQASTLSTTVYLATWRRWDPTWRVHVHKQLVTRYTRRGEGTRKRVFMAKVVHCTYRMAVLPFRHVTVNYSLWIRGASLKISVCNFGLVSSRFRV